MSEPRRTARPKEWRVKRWRIKQKLRGSEVERVRSGGKADGREMMEERRKGGNGETMGRRIGER